MTNNLQILPCPFCGSSEIKTVVDDGIHFEQCRKCEATGPTGFKRGDEDDVTWNTRAVMKAMSAEHKYVAYSSKVEQ